MLGQVMWPNTLCCYWSKSIVYGKLSCVNETQPTNISQPQVFSEDSIIEQVTEVEVTDHTHPLGADVKDLIAFLRRRCMYHFLAYFWGQMSRLNGSG